MTQVLKEFCKETFSSKVVNKENASNGVVVLAMDVKQLTDSIVATIVLAKNGNKYTHIESMDSSECIDDVLNNAFLKAQEKFDKEGITSSLNLWEARRLINGEPEEPTA